MIYRIDIQEYLRHFLEPNLHLGNGTGMISLNQTVIKYRILFALDKVV